MAATAQIRPLEKEQILDFLREHKAFFQTEFGIEVLGLFGSFARGEQTAKSDVDLLFEFNENCKDLFLSELRLQRFLKKQFGRKVDLANRKWLNRHMKEHILSTTFYA